MGFSVSPTRIGSRRSRWAVAGLVVAACALVAVAVVGGNPSTSTAPSTRTAGVAATVALPSPAVSPGPSSGDGAQAAARLPATITCQQFEPAPCRRVVNAAVAIISPGAGTIRAVSVWRSLLCDDSIRCPPQRLRDTTPVGSVVLDFGAGSSVYVNVIATTNRQDSRAIGADDGDVPATSDLEAWVVR